MAASAESSPGGGKKEPPPPTTTMTIQYNRAVKSLKDAKTRFFKEKRDWDIREAAYKRQLKNAAEENKDKEKRIEQAEAKATRMRKELRRLDKMNYKETAIAKEEIATKMENADLKAKNEVQHNELIRLTQKIGKTLQIRNVEKWRNSQLTKENNALKEQNCKLKEEKEHWEEETLCKICFVKKAELVFPCGHTSCDTCHLGLFEKCHVCRLSFGDEPLKKFYL